VLISLKQLLKLKLEMSQKECKKAGEDWILDLRLYKKILTLLKELKPFSGTDLRESLKWNLLPKGQ